MKFILENYLLFVLIGLFFIFALIGYIIDTLRKNINENNNDNIPQGVNEHIMDIPSMPQTDVMESPEIKSVDITNINDNNANNADELLNTYNETNNE